MSFNVPANPFPTIGLNGSPFAANQISALSLDGYGKHSNSWFQSNWDQINVYPSTTLNAEIGRAHV